MITDEEIKRITLQCAGRYSIPDVMYALLDGEIIFSPDALEQYTLAIYQLGRQHQRESDAALCAKLGGGLRGAMVAEAVLANTGEVKA